MPKRIRHSMSPSSISTRRSSTCSFVLRPWIYPYAIDRIKHHSPVPWPRRTTKQPILFSSESREPPNRYVAFSSRQAESSFLFQLDNKGRNFLHIAVQNGDIESVLFLLTVQVNVNNRVQDASQFTPLHLSVQIGSEIILRNLVRHSSCDRSTLVNGDV